MLCSFMSLFNHDDIINCHESEIGTIWHAYEIVMKLDVC